MIVIFDVIGTGQGAYRLLRTRVERLNRMEGLRNVIVCPPGRFASRLRREGLPIIEFQSIRELVPWRVVGELWRFYRLLARHRPDLLHTHNSKSGAIGRLCGWLYNLTHDNRIVIVHQVHGFHFIHLRGMARALFVAIETALSAISDAILFQNRREYRYARRRFSPHCNPILIGNGIDLGELTPFRTEGRRALPTGGKRIVCVARIEPIKNHEMLIDALACLTQRLRFTHFQAILIGEGRQEHLLRRIARHGLQDTVRLEGLQDREATLREIGRAHVAVLTSSKEGMPRALMEALFLGVPCVATRVSGSEETIVDGETGALVRLGDVEGCAAALHRLLTDAALWERQAERAHQYALHYFDEKPIVHRLSQLYCQLVKRCNRH